MGFNWENPIECKNKWSLNERISHLRTLGTFKIFSLLLYSSLSNPLQCSRLENPRDGGAWWAAVSGVP